MHFLPRVTVCALIEVLHFLYSSVHLCSVLNSCRLNVYLRLNLFLYYATTMGLGGRCPSARDLTKKGGLAGARQGAAPLALRLLLSVAFGQRIKKSTLMLIQTFLSILHNGLHAVKRTSGWILFATLALGASVFILDPVTPADVTVGMLYVVVVLVALWSPEREIPAHCCRGMHIARCGRIRLRRNRLMAYAF